MLERLFRLSAAGTTVRTEVIAGTGRARNLDWLAYLFAAVFVARYAWL